MIQTVLQSVPHKPKNTIPYTYLRNGIYYFRYRLPKALLNKNPSSKKFIRISLFTKSSNTARVRSSELLGLLHEFKDKIMAKKLVSGFTTEFITCYMGNNGRLEKLEIKPEENRTEGDIYADFKEKNPELFEDSEPRDLPSSNDMEISQAIKVFLEEKQKLLPNKSFESLSRDLRPLKYLHGNNGIHLSGKEIDELLCVSERMPKGNIKPYRSMSFEQRIELAIANKVPESDQLTSGKHALKAYQSFFSWLVQNRCLDKSPLSERRVKLKKGNKRGAFEVHQANKIVNYAVNLKNENLKWLLLIMAYSGMRNSEIERLEHYDIKKCPTTGIWYFNIKSTKTNAGIRKIPIAQILFDLGILDFINKCNGARLFDVSERYMTTQYQKVKKACDLPSKNDEGNELTLYSFRHTVTSMIRATGVNEAYSMALMGHSRKNGVHDTYTHTSLIPLDKLKDVIDQIPYKPD